MDFVTNLGMGFAIALSPINLLFVTVGVIVGTLIGALPGIGPVSGLSILIPLAFGMNPISAMILMCGIYYGCMYGGTITSVLMNVPGESASIMTCLDGHAMARQGRAGPALTIAAIARRAGVTARSLETIFHKSIGETPGAYYLRLRLGAARRLVLDTRIPMADIAARTGFSSAAAFSRAFSRAFGKAPVRMRRA